MSLQAASARFSPCRRYRYVLGRTWDKAKGQVAFLMLNPSTADELNNDPTVERCQRRAVRMGFGSLAVVNLFAFRATDPGALHEVADPVGPGNDRAILQVASAADMVVCACGTHGRHLGRARQVCSLLDRAGVRLHALRINRSDGSPAHPLYIPYAVTPVDYRLHG